MARTAAIGTWYLNEKEVEYFRKLREALQLKNGAIASAIGVDDATFSQASRGHGSRGFKLEKKEALRGFLSAEVEREISKARDGRGDPVKAAEAEGLLAELFISDDDRRASRYVVPGRALPSDASNYVALRADESISRILDSTGNSVCIMGGPRSGKSSLFLRIADRAEQMHRTVRMVDMSELWTQAARASTRADQKLTLLDLMNQVLFALSQDPKPLAKPGSADGFLVQLMQSRLIEIMRRTDLAHSVVLLDGFNDVIDHAVDLTDAAIIQGCLFSHTVRRDRCKIIIPDDGIVGASDMVSEQISRAEQVFTARMSLYDVQKLACAVLGSDINFDTTVASQMMDSFGSFVFLHHVTLDMVRTKLAGSVTLSEEAVHSAVEGAISQTLDLLRAEDDPKTVVDPIAREMIRFAARIEHILVSLDRMIDPKPGVAAQSMDVTHALADVDGTAEDIPPSYLVKRALNWVGLQPEGGRSPEFVRVLAQKRAARR